MTALIVGCLLILYSINFHIAYGERMKTISLNIGNYKFDLDKPLGQGTFGTVFKGTTEGTGTGPKVIAIKLSNKRKPQTADGAPGMINDITDETYLNVMDEEIEAFTKLGLKGKKRDGFPTLYDTGNIGDRKYIAMDLLGADLLRLVESMTLTNVLIFAEQMLDRLEYIHGFDFAHADLKPDNFALGANNVLNIIDFGLIQKFADEEGIYYKSEFVNVRRARGTPCYMPARQQNATVTYARDDVESLGFVFYFMLSGMHPPWDVLAIGQQIIMKKNTPVSALFPWCLDAFVFFIEFARSLPDTAEIDYEFFRNILREARYSHDIHEHAVLDELKQASPLSQMNSFGMKSDASTSNAAQSVSKPSPSPASPSLSAHVVPPLPISPPYPVGVGMPLDPERMPPAAVGMPPAPPGIPPMPEIPQSFRRNTDFYNPSAPIKKYMHKGPCPFSSDMSQVQPKQRSELFVNMFKIYARGIVYPLELKDEVTKKKDKVRIFKVIEPGYISFVRVQKKSQTEPSITHHEENVYELLTPKAKSKPIGVPTLVASGYQSCHFYTITALDEGEPLSEYLKRVRLSSKMIIKFILEVLDILQSLHDRGVLLLHFGLDMFWVLRIGRERKIFVRDLSVAKPFRTTKVHANFNSYDPYNSKRFMSIRAHDDNRLYSRDDIESLAYLAMELFRNCNGTASTQHKNDDHLKQIKERAQPATPIEKLSDPIVIMLIYAKQLKLFDSVNYDYLQTLIKSHCDFDPNFDWLKEEIATSGVVYTIYSWCNWAYYSQKVLGMAYAYAASSVPPVSQ